MNVLSGVMACPMAHRIGWVLLHSIWQGALVGGVFEVARFALRRRSANVRYLAGCLALALLLALPLATLVVETVPSAQASDGTPRNAMRAGGVAPGYGAGGAFVAGPGYASPSFLQLSRGFLGQLAPWLAAAWLLGVAFCSVKLARSWSCLEKFRLHDNEPVDPGWLERLISLRHRLGISRPVRLVKSALVEVPTVIGWFRPVILLPVSCLTGLTPGQLEAVLAHELAHVRRLDYLANAFQCVVETLLFYHPVVWWISRCVREERENCCDDLVIEVCGDRLAYARALATLEEFRGDFPEMALAAGGGSLLNRVRRMLGMSNDTGPASARQWGGVALLGVGLVIFLLGIFLHLSPTTYQAVARIRVERDANANAGATDRVYSSYDPYFVQTQFELIQSEAILGRVIGRLDLNTAWGRKYQNGATLKTPESMAMLRARLDLRPIRNTMLVAIRAFSDDKQEAADIANAIADAYRDYGQEQRLQLALRGIKALEAQYQEQEAEINKAEANLSRLRRELNISGSDTLTTAPSPTIESSVLTREQGDLITYETELKREQAQLQGLAELAPDRRRGAIQVALGQQDPELGALLNELDLAEQKLVSLANDYDPHHPAYQTATTVRDKDLSMANRRVEDIMFGLSNKVSSLETMVVSLRDRLNRVREEDIARTEQSAPYFDEKRKLDELLRFKQVLDMKIASEKLDANLPKTSMVEIVDRALPALRPAGPNRLLATALMGFGGVLTLTGFLMLQGKGKTNPANAER